MIQLLGLGSTGKTTPLNTSEGSTSTAAEGNDFAHWLAQSNPSHHSIKASEPRSLGAPQSSEPDTADSNAVEESWLTLLEDMREDDGHQDLEQLAARHGLDLDSLKTLLQDAVSQLDAMSSTTFSMQVTADGKELPDDFQVTTTAAKLRQLLEQGDSLQLDPSLQALLDEVGQLPESEQALMQAELSQMLGLTGAEDAAYTQIARQFLAIDAIFGDQFNEHASEEADESELNQVLALLSQEDIETLRAFVEAQQQALSSQDDTERAAQMAQRLRALEQALDSVSRDNVTDLDVADGDLAAYIETLLQQSELSEATDPSRVALRSELEKLALDIDVDATNGVVEPDLKARLQGLLERINQGAEVSDSEALEGKMDAELSAQLDYLINQLQQAELTSEEQAQLSVLVQSVDQLELDTPEDDELSSDEAVLASVLAELRQLAARHDIDTRSVGSTSVESPSLPPAAQALSQVARQLREQLQQALQAGGDDTADGDSDALDSSEFFRRIGQESASVLTNTQSDSRASQGVTSSMSQFGVNTNGAASREPAQVNGPQQPNQSAYEVARQTQQAIDILGPGAPERLRERVAVMFNTRTQAAEMRLDPPDLGRLNIRVNMNQEQASVTFQVTTPQAREALEQSLPRLRELLAEQGIQLADADISEQRQEQAQNQQGEGGEQSAPSTASTQSTESDAVEVVDIDTPVQSGDRRVDYFV